MSSVTPTPEITQEDREILAGEYHLDSHVRYEIAAGAADEYWQVAPALRAIARLRLERDEARKNSVANAQLAHDWMAAHDLLKAGEPYKLPSPAAETDLTAARALLAEAATFLDRICHGDHDRGCDGRQYHCKCGYDKTNIDQAADLASRIREMGK